MFQLKIQLIQLMNKRSVEILFWENKENEIIEYRRIVSEDEKKYW